MTTEDQIPNTSAEGKGANAANGGSTSDEITEQSQIESLQAEVSSLNDKFLRSLAEMENMRKRMERDKTELLKYATESFMKDLLPVLDGFEKAALAKAQNDKSASQESVIEGFMMVNKMFHEALHKNGLEAIEAAGREFDPNLHQAIQRIETDGISKEIVKDEFAKGYTLKGRLLRAAIVSVAVPKD